jgi:hypothetical protein
MKSNSEAKTRRQFSTDTKWHAPSERRSPREPHAQPSLRSIPDQSDPVLSMGAHRRTRRAPNAPGSTARAPVTAPHRRSLAQVQRLREVIAEITSENLRLKKGGLVSEPHPRYTAAEKAAILGAVKRACSVRRNRSMPSWMTCVSAATFHRWCERAAQNQRARIRIIRHRMAKANACSAPCACMTTSGAAFRVALFVSARLLSRRPGRVSRGTTAQVARGSRCAACVWGGTGFSGQKYH